MHHAIEISVPSSATDRLAEEIVALDGVVNVSVHRAASVKPSGDVVAVHVLNQEVDAVLSAADRARAAGPVVISTGAVESLVEPGRQRRIDDDADESPWEEFERGLRHNSRITINYIALMALGGAVAVAGLLSPPVPQALALAASAIMTPAFEPVAELAVGLVRRSAYTVRRALVSIALGYAVLATAGAATFAVLRALGLAAPSVVASSEGVHLIVDPTASDWLVAACGAAAGLIIITSFRQAVLAGALIALALVPGGAMIGAGLVAGDGLLALEALQRVALDMLLVVVLGAAVVAVKQRVVHGGRTPMP